MNAFCRGVAQERLEEDLFSVSLEERLFLKWVELPVLIVISVISENSMLRLYSLQRLKRAENKCICRFESIFVVQNLIQSDLIILAD